jgi:hypothetical protein
MAVVGAAATLDQGMAAMSYHHSCKPIFEGLDRGYDR